MKAGICGSLNDPNNTYPYWVLPDKQMKVTSITKGGSLLSGWDGDQTYKQTEEIRAYLSGSCTGHWTISNHRFYFSSKEDWEMFQTMCVLGWR